MSELFDFGKNILEKQPFSVLLGTELKCQCQVVTINDGEERVVAVAQGTITKID